MLRMAKLCAPKEVVVRESVLSEEEVSRGTRRLADAVKLREERFDQLTRHAIAVHPEEEERMRVAGENAEELTAFLEKDDNPDRKKLLDSLTKKDNKDLRAEVLEDHLSAKRGSWCCSATGWDSRPPTCSSSSALRSESCWESMPSRYPTAPWTIPAASSRSSMRWG